MNPNSATWIDECRARCQQIKYLAEPFEWRERPNHSKTMIAGAGLLDDKSVAIPGLRVKFEWQERKYGEYASYALMYRHHATVYRAFMIEAMPSHCLSHRDRHRTIYGSHILLGDARHGEDQYIVKQIATGIALSDHARWMKRFQRHARAFSSRQYTLASVSGPLFDEAR